MKTGEQITLRFCVEKHRLPETIRMYLRHGDAADIWQLRPTVFERGKTFYEVTFSIPVAGIYYYRFEAQYQDGSIDFIGRDKLGYAVKGDHLPEWQITVFEPSYVTPKRSGSDIIYHIFVDRFCKVGGKPTPEVGTVRDWKQDVTVTGPDGVYRANDFYGGNLKGVISKLDYLAELGVTIIYLSPIFYSHSNHRYDTADYSKIDPIIGTEQELDELIAKAAQRGMKIMLDGVFNHTGSDSIYFNKEGFFDSVGAYQSKNSPYYDWYVFSDYPKVYDSWWGIQCVPTLNKHSKSLRRFLFGEDGILEKWTAKGVNWRLDVVDELPSDFVRELRAAVKRTDPQALLLGEVWEDASTKVSYGELRKYFTEGEIDGVMNYVFKDAILDYAKGGWTSHFAAKVLDIVENYPRQSLDSCMTMLGSHDTCRIVNVMAGVRGDYWSKKKQLEYRIPDEQYEIAVKKVKIAAAIEFLLPGMPSIYYGDEAGVQGFVDPINRRPYPWGAERQDLVEFYRRLGKIRHGYAEALDKISFDKNELLVMRRFGKKELILVANSTDRVLEYDLQAPSVDLLRDRPISGKVFAEPNSVYIFVKAEEYTAEL